MSVRRLPIPGTAVSSWRCRPAPKYRKRRLVAGIVLLLAVLPAAQAQVLTLPAAPQTPAAAATAFPDRAGAVLGYAACGLEQEYLRIRGEMAQGNFEHQGEDLTSLLLAKMAWLRAGQSCQVTVRAENVAVFDEDGGQLNPPLQTLVGMIPGLPSCAQSLTAGPLQGTAGSQLHYLLTQECLRQQVNETILAMRKKGLMGTNGTSCVVPPRIASAGDFDVNVRELVRILYVAGNAAPDRRPAVLDEGTVSHMYRELLAARGGPSEDDYSVLSGCADIANEELGSPEDTVDRRGDFAQAVDALGDAGEWLLDYWLALLGILAVAASASTGGLAALPIAAAGTVLATGAGSGVISPVLPFADVRIGETENHRLMIETSRFLTNQALIAYLRRTGYGGYEELEEEQAAVRAWLLARMGDIARGDFQEYNARPYTRYSLEALVNLHDFADFDQAVQTAAHNLLDLSGAKFAVGAHGGRRIAPFRRLEEYDGRAGDPDYLFNMSKGADHEVGRAIVLAGQTALLPPFQPQDPAPRTLVNTAMSSYRLPGPALDLVFDRAEAMEQEVRHTSIEHYWRSPAFTLSAGGVRSGPTIEGPLGIGTRDADRGVAMPTVLLPTSFGWFQHELIRFDGVGEGWQRSDNLCVYRGFACGLMPSWGTLLAQDAACLVSAEPADEGMSFFSSARCRDFRPPHFYVAMLQRDCDGRFCPAGARWGLLEAVEAPAALPSDQADPEFDAFRSTRTTALRDAANSVDATGRFSYAPQGGPRITATVALPRADVVEVNGTPVYRVPTRGVLEGGREAGLWELGPGHYRIVSPAGVAQEIDMSDAQAPRRDP